jgi:hypothetical protein
MDDEGFVYVPDACAAKEPCRLHVALHGCKQSVGDIGDAFVRHAGYNEWADTNHIIVLYPQTHVLTLTTLGITNPESCWDWWGYLDEDPTVTPTYLLKSGKQIRTIKAMADRVTSGVTTASASLASQSAEPEAMHAVDRSDTAIDVVWSSVTGVAGYDLYRAGSGDADFRQIATVSGLSYGDSGLKPATQYRYEVRVAAPGAAGSFSPVASATTLQKPAPCDDPGSCPVH